MTGGIVIAFGAVGAVLALGPVFVQVTLGAGPSGWGLVVAAFGVGMGLGMATAGQAAKVVERETVFVWSLIGAAVALFVLATMPNLSWAVVFTVWLGAFCGLAWVSGYTLLQENVVDEYRGRTFGALTTMSRMVLFLSLAAFPTLAQIFQSIARAAGSTEFFVGAQRIDLSGSRLALWVAGGLVVGAGLNTRRLLKRYRLSRPVPLTLVPKLKRPPATGLFIAFEGVEGAGKGTQIGMAEEFLRSQGMDVLVTREPGGTRIGERIRDLLLDPAVGSLDARAEALLFAASRAQTVANVIRPALAEGKVVICDRYVDSSLAYQGWARGLGEPDVLTPQRLGDAGVVPGSRDPAARRARDRARALARAARPDRAGGGGLPGEGRRRVPQDRGGASGALRGGGRGPGAGVGLRPGARRARARDRRARRARLVSRRPAVPSAA